ncbi:bifunctional ADP-dependent NAD(P)H-hydrate dehydratase/NAD(P)H-hydrate epimerase [Pradoshia eiseniae]|uniref:Bifunctional NAD(P)H-hydrate repair enzyme n=2 Tax=Pradoshia eiseniae TaxID=2064768 RepID=A0A2S7N4Q1_9BACI|nr:bifunctional ADP-dependent NAD(P)H-hydrate dehydratase/NAD(P)H-hydrate epimerase [Pradoshia eiseniae]
MIVFLYTIFIGGLMNVNIYFAEEIRECDRLAEDSGLSIFSLMENSGHALFEGMSKLLHKKQRIGILAGGGNNGGDGIVLSRLLLNHGYKAELIFPLGLPSSRVAQDHLDYYKTCGYRYSTEMEGEYDVLIDGLFGIGFRPPFTKQMIGCLDFWKKSNALKIAIDIPSGVEANHGRVEAAFQADHTFCLHGAKPSAFLYPSGTYYGELHIVDIGLPQRARFRVWTEEDVRGTWPAAKDYTHKGTFGTGLLIAGSRQMPGCAILAGTGAMRAGVGKLVMATEKTVADSCVISLPEATYVDREDSQWRKDPSISKIAAVAIGPGLKPDDSLENLITDFLEESEFPVILDAGALSERSYPKGRKSPVILTPHPGEMARITGKTVAEVNENRIQLASDYAISHHVTVVLKGMNTVIAFPDGTGFVNVTGNRGLSKGGTGDTLTGILLGMASQGYQPSMAANAVYLHGKTAELYAEEKAPSSMLASDIMQIWPVLLRKMELS